MHAFLNVVLLVLHYYTYILIASAILSWLMVFGVVNTRNPIVNRIADVLYQLTEPLLRPIRKYVPSVGGLDLSFLVLVLIIYFLEQLIFDLSRVVPF